MVQVCPHLLALVLVHELDDAPIRDERGCRPRYAVVVVLVRGRHRVGEDQFPGVRPGGVGRLAELFAQDEPELGTPLVVSTDTLPLNVILKVMMSVSS